MKYINNIFLIVLVLCLVFNNTTLQASSHREAPLISNDPLADNVDLYAFKNPDNQDFINIIATYNPMQLPHGGPNYYSFGENIRYEIHVDNDATVPGDEITYRFTFKKVNEAPQTFFNIFLGNENLKTTYTLEKSTDGGQSFQTIVDGGVVPPNNIGERSINGAAGLNSDYATLSNNSITTASSGEMVFAGPSDDPFFVDLGGIFDLGDAPRQNGTPVDGLACYNVSTIALQIPISNLLKSGASSTPQNILDGDYIIGVWASASRPSMTTLSKTNGPVYSGDWVQVSRLGMPLTNEAVIPIGYKDFWNSISPYDEIAETDMDEFFYNPELALYMDDDLFGGAVPAFTPLRIQSNTLGAFDFTNGADGLFPLKNTAAVAGTALDDNIFGTLLLPAEGKPRSVDLWPAFHTGVPNFRPYQLATGKNGDPLAEGKPFINNFLPNGGDMLRLNMAVPATDRSSSDFSSLGLVQAAVLGLTAAPYNTNANLEFIPNMDGFPNGRRLEDDVTRIELQAVSGIVLAAIGLWYDDYDPNSSPSPVTDDLLNVLTFSTGVEVNDVAFRNDFPYVALPFSGTGDCSGELITEEPECTNDAGGMAQMMQFVCAGAAASAQTVGENIQDGSILMYVLHDGSSNLGTIYAMNSSGMFTNDGSYPANTQLSISAIVGPPINNGIDLNDACTVVALPGAPLSFLLPIEISHDTNCNSATGEYTVSFSITGGYPSFPNSGVSYNVSGDFNGTVAPGVTTTIGPIEDGASYSITVSDDFNCTKTIFEPSVQCDKLPIELISFTGKANQLFDQLDWLTATEIENDYFTLKHSTDGLSFNTIATLKGAGTSSQENSYQFRNEAISNGINYYQLFQTDFDGTKVLAGTITLFRKTADSQIQLYPNPVKDMMYVYVEEQLPDDTKFEIYNNQGQLVLQKAVAFNANNSTIMLNMNDLGTGFYTLMIKSSSIVRSIKFAKL